jgi:L-amino acid N-acyltransferase YncA
MAMAAPDAVSDPRAIRPAVPNDAESLCVIYNHYVLHTVATFEEQAIDGREMARRIAAVRETGLPWQVLETADGVAGYAYADRWKGRSAYRHSVETTIYLAPDAIGRGFGSRLYGELLVALQALPIHAAMGGIALPNPASIALHERCGFRKVAHLEQVGRKFGTWIDVGYWQRLLQPKE